MPSYTLMKVLLLGDSGVGKTCLALRFVGEAFQKSFKVTVGIDFKVKEFIVDGKPVKVQIWDTAGQERFRSVATNYYRKAAGVVLVYDVNNLESFENLENWMDLLNQHTDEGIAKILVGNKLDISDTKSGKRAVTTEMGKAFAKKHGVKFLETSAKTSKNVEKAMVDLIRDIQVSGIQVREVDRSECRIHVLGESETEDDQDNEEESVGKKWGCCGSS
mmetsp:Transcript_12203/g.17006  ORF Transcript_12203/g.17006 Transcript_12203/m.17006 type:complete len:218 (-) Transcript_12203:100-753(-)|eukprot:CAMPEP_0184488466 /NCGR_PEP_ID=MMETSP0113_2-20130426/12067_1 /TAXON_ID=91329 /ORGANISM="Norrisiella sphaerica, Strain BC52" /LENGTH=217 /DNA_ID=CAMNT_0026871267 /DNA_START=26 /DNA_END=682 /DNA_ORIENTATION=+